MVRSRPLFTLLEQLLSQQLCRTDFNRTTSETLITFRPSLLAFSVRHAEGLLPADVAARRSWHSTVIRRGNLVRISAPRISNFVKIILLIFSKVDRTILYPPEAPHLYMVPY